MREYKFRAWNKHNGMMTVRSIGTFGLGFDSIQDVACYFDEEHGSYSTWTGGIDERKALQGSRKHCVIMQFINRVDKNGKDVYEGDLVKVKFNNGGEYEEPVLIYYDNGTFCVGMGYLQDCKELEIIGNVYQNPELV